MSGIGESSDVDLRTIAALASCGMHPHGQFRISSHQVRPNTYRFANDFDAFEALHVPVLAVGRAKHRDYSGPASAFVDIFRGFRQDAA